MNGAVSSPSDSAIGTNMSLDKLVSTIAGSIPSVSRLSAAVSSRATIRSVVTGSVVVGAAVVAGGSVAGGAVVAGAAVVTGTVVAAVLVGAGAAVVASAASSSPPQAPRATSAEVTTRAANREVWGVSTM